MSKKSLIRRRAIKAGYRSGFEETASDLLKKLNIDFGYESNKIKYTRPAMECTYTPDFTLNANTVVETKGLFITSDRNKQLLIKKQHPDLRIILCFQDPNKKIYKGSKTRYRDWCDKNKIEWCTLATLKDKLTTPHINGKVK